MSRKSRFVDIELDTTTDELAAAVDAGRRFSAPDSDFVSRADDFGVGTFTDARTMCQVDLGTVSPGPPAQVYVAIVCPPDETS